MAVSDLLFRLNFSHLRLLLDGLDLGLAPRLVLVPVLLGFLLFLGPGDVNILQLVVIGALAGLGGIEGGFLVFVQETGDELDVVLDLLFLVLDHRVEVLVGEPQRLEFGNVNPVLYGQSIEFPLPVGHLTVRSFDLRKFRLQRVKFGQ